MQIYDNIADHSRTTHGLTRDYMTPETFAGLLDALFSVPAEKGKVVYFFGGDVGNIKIGFTAMPKVREQMLAARYGADMRFLATCEGGRSRETAYHLKFEHLRQEGEWFSRAPDIFAEIARLSPCNGGGL